MKKCLNELFKTKCFIIFVDKPDSDATKDRSDTTPAQDPVPIFDMGDPIIDDQVNILTC